MPIYKELFIDKKYSADWSHSTSNGKCTRYSGQSTTSSSLKWYLAPNKGIGLPFSDFRSIDSSKRSV